MSIQYFMSMIYHYIVEHTQPRALIISKFIFKFDSIHLSRSMKKYLDNEKWLHCPRPAVKIPERPFGNERKTWHVWKKREGKISRRIKDPGQGWWSLRVAAVRRRGETKRDERGMMVATTVACWSRAGGGAKLHRSACHPQLYNLQSFAPPLHPLVRSLVGYWFPRVATPMGC